ncbi:hypothetical protein [Pseudomonas sp. UMAB-40]|uniref:hypothetical protein n=1 Tax=Pseudomonas sp. UMAB-40 TaxID=1365407 RepID=UPI001C5A1003|nr:hypothetical protein [Pseudomonas sp. UMAB-40]
MDYDAPPYPPELLQAEELALRQSLAEEHAEKQAVLDQVRLLVTESVFIQIEEALYDGDHTSTHDYQIAPAPLGEPQDEGFALGDIFVDQTAMAASQAMISPAP